MQTMTRRSFLKAAGATAIPLVAGMPLVAKAQFNQGLPSSASVRTENGDISFSYSLDSTSGKSPFGHLHWPNLSTVMYSSVRAARNTIHFSSARLFLGGAVPSNLRAVSLVVISYSPAPKDDPFGLNEGRARLQLGNGRVIEMEARGCFLTTACTSARGLPDDCMELQTLRTFRDGYMKTQASEGQAMIREYYHTAPAVVSAINAREDAAEIHDWMYRDLVLPSVRLIQRGQNAKALDHYAAFFQSLRDETLHGVNPCREAQCIS